MIWRNFTKIDKNLRKRKHTLCVCQPHKSERHCRMEDNASAGSSEQQAIDEGSNLFVSKAHEQPNSCFPLDFYTDKESNDIFSSWTSDISFTSAKQCKKSEAALVTNHWWGQSLTDLVVTVFLNEDEAGHVEVYITNTEVHIKLSADKSHVIKFFKPIQKEKSRTQQDKEGDYSVLIFSFVKQHPGLWEQLELPCRDEVNNSSAMPVPRHDSEKQIKIEGVWSMAKDKDQEILADGRAVKAAETVEEQKIKSDPQIMEKEEGEESEYQLDHLKNDFFERDSVLTLQVYTKNVDNNATKINFNKQGFVLKFRTQDPKFLQLHEGTTSETTFAWPVSTRGEIVPDECRFKVKGSVIEITLQKTSSDRWASLEAPTRKDNVDNQKCDQWISISKSNQPAAAGATLTSPSLLGAAAAAVGQASASSDAMFDDISDVGTKDEARSIKGVSIPGNSHSGLETDSGALSGRNFPGRTISSLDWNKPLAKVHPLNSQAAESAAVISPGFAGLVNLGNTCFMNCVLQVLANTREFRDYFLDGRFENEINEDNPLGMRGQLAFTFGVLLRNLWSCKKYCWEPCKLKDLISKKNPQFFGFAQHDAHEFLAFLLDGLHEDLNRIRKKPYTQTVDSDGKPDEKLAVEAWTQYKQRNDSVVVDLFQGQYKSKLVCPKCGKVSITFDPFLYLSVPLPKKKKIVTVTFMWKESYKKPVRHQIQVQQDSTVEKLMDELSSRTKVRPSDMRIFEAFRGRIHKFFSAGASLANVEQKDNIIACEVLSEELAGEKVLEIPVMQRTTHPVDYPSRCAFCHKPCSDGILLKRCMKCFKVGYCDHTCQRNHWNVHKAQCSTAPEPIGCPFILSVPVSRATYGYLVKHMEEFSRFSVDVFQPPVKSVEVGSKPAPRTPTSNLNSTLSQSCSSLNSLDSLSSASSTCTLTGEQSDPQAVEVGDKTGDSFNDSEQCVLASGSTTMLPSSSETFSSSECCVPVETPDSLCLGGSDSGIESAGGKSTERLVPVSQVMGIQALEADRDKAPVTFHIKPVTMEGMGIKGAERLEDRGDLPLDLINKRFLSMDWRNNEKQPFYVLVQSKELEAIEANNLNNMAASCSNKPTLHQCLELFTEPEILSPEEAWYCPSCKKHVEASKQMTIWRLPHTLIIQLKRFSFQNFLMRSKIKKHVDFPTRELDMSRYCVNLKSDESPATYDLYGVVNHHGHLIGGHYTSYVKCCDSISGTDEVGWRLCDDSRVVSIASERMVVTSDAYLLFYRRRGCRAVIGSSSSEAKPWSTTSTETQAPNTSTDMSHFAAGDGDARAPLNNRVVTETVTKRSWEHSWCESSDDSDDETMNRQNIIRGAPYVNRKPSALQDSSDKQNEDDTEQEDTKEKGDEEKDFDDYEREEGERALIIDDDGSDEGDKEGRGLVTDSHYNLGYTDMEAVD